MRALAIARASGRRVLRDRVALFFLIILPIVVIVVVGAVAQGFNTFRVEWSTSTGPRRAVSSWPSSATPRDWR